MRPKYEAISSELGGCRRILEALSGLDELYDKGVSDKWFRGIIDDASGVEE